MKTKIGLLLLSTGLFCSSLVAEQARESTQGPTELIYYDSTKAYNGYTLWGSRGKAYLIDMQGRVVRTWNVGTSPEFLAYNGNILDAAKSNNSEGFKELDWNGNVVWQYYETRADYVPHHDWVRIYNKKLKAYTTIYIANKTVTNAQALAAGCDPKNAPYDGAQMDALVEVDMSGKIVWEWWFFDHGVQDIDSTKPTYGVIKNNPGKIDLNLPGRPVRKDWLHCNSLDYNEALGYLVTNSVQGEFYVIDHDNTFIAGNPDSSKALAASKAGDFLYRFGDPARYEQGDPPSISADWTQSSAGHKQIGGAHDIHWIAAGLPGEGNFLIFNNGQYLFEQTAQSYIFEINPYLNSSLVNTGKYVNPPDAGYWKWEIPNQNNQMKQKKNMSNQIVWKYYSLNNQNFFSHIGSGAQRLPNGNTFICAMTTGHFFEVTAGNATTQPTVVWEYINPVTNDGIKKWITDALPCYNAAFRAYRYGPDFPAFAGKDMTPGPKITDMTAIALESFTTHNSNNVTVVQNRYSGVAQILIEKVQKNATVSIYNSMGKQLISKNITSNSFLWETGNIPNGMYLLTVKTGEYVMNKNVCLVK